MKISYKKTYEKITGYLKSQKDVIIVTDEELELTLIYQEQGCDIATFNKDYIENIRADRNKTLDQIILGVCKKYVPVNPDKIIDEILQALFSGLLVVYSKKEEIFYYFDLSKVQSRHTEESTSEPSSSYRSKDGFVENYKDNIMLLRTRMKSSNLVIDEYYIGERSKTRVGLLSIKDIHNEEIKQSIIKELENIKIDAVLQHEDISNSFQKDKKLPVFMYVGSPDLAAYHLLEGQFIILIDRIPSVMVMPTTFSFYTKLRIDSVNIKGFAVLERIFILFSLIASTLFLSLLCSFLTYQSDSLSLSILSTFKISQKGVIFPLYYEIFFVLLVFEVYYYIIYRSAKITMSSMIVLIGGVLIGQNAIEAGLTGVLILTLTAIAFLATFIVSSNVTLSMSISVVRIFMVVMSIFYGMFGFTIGLIAILYMMYTEETCDVPFFYPFMPINFKEIKEYFISPSDNKISKRSKALNVTDDTRKESK